MLELVLAILSVGCASVPMLLFLFFVWWNDRYDREPLWLVALTFLWGAVGAVGLALVFSLIFNAPFQMVLSASVAGAVGAVIIAPLVEEPMKALILGPVSMSRHFDNMTDGFVYGAAAGLGFGMTENFLYFVGMAMEGDPMAWAMNVIIRTFYSAVMHSLTSSIVGAAIGFAMFRGCLARLVVPPLGLLVAMGIHAMWNGLLTADELARLGGQLTGLNLLLFPLEFLAIFVVFQVCLLVESFTLRRELAEEAREGRIPADHASGATSWFRRLGGGWVPRGVPRSAYIRALTTLAMRKSQARRTTGSKRVFYDKEVERWRKVVGDLLLKAR